MIETHDSGLSMSGGMIRDIHFPLAYPPDAKIKYFGPIQFVFAKVKECHLVNS